MVVNRDIVHGDGESFSAQGRKNRRPVSRQLIQIKLDYVDVVCMRHIGTDLQRLHGVHIRESNIITSSNFLPPPNKRRYPAQLTHPQRTLKVSESIVESQFDHFVEKAACF